MPQTSPISWILFSNLFFLMMMMISISFNYMDLVKNNIVVINHMKKWSW